MGQFWGAVRDKALALPRKSAYNRRYSLTNDIRARGWSGGRPQEKTPILSVNPFDRRYQFMCSKAWAAIA